MKKIIILFFFVIFGQIAKSQDQKSIYLSVKKWNVGEYSSLSNKYLFDKERDVSGIISISSTNKVMKFTIDLGGKEASVLTVYDVLPDTFVNGNRQMNFKAKDITNNAVTITFVDKNDGTYSVYTYIEKTAVVFFCTPL
mgnify:CR=1 FL=1